MSKDKNSGPAADFFESPTKTGWLTKLGGTGLKANWRRRYVVLDHHYLFYYKTDKDRSPAGIICLPEYDIVAKADYKECKKPNSFVITSSSNIVATTQSDQKRPYFMFADSEQECQEWINAVEREMTAMIDPGQKPYFSVIDTGIHTTVKNGFQDVVVGNFDDITRSEDGPRLEHVTANRPKKPHTRAPSRGAKDFIPFDEDDISSFSFSPISELEEPKKIEKRPPKKPSHNMKPMKPPSHSLGTQPERTVTSKPKLAVKPNFLKSQSQTIETVASPVKNEFQTLTPIEQSVTETENAEFAPKPTPRRKAPTVPEVSRESKIISPILPTHPRSLTQAPSPSEPIPASGLIESPPDTSPARRHAPSVPSQPREEQSYPSAIKHSPSQPNTSYHQETPIKPSPSLPDTSHHQEIPLKHSPSQPDTSYHQETAMKPSPSLPDTSHHQETPIKPPHYLQDTSHHQETPIKSSPSLPDTSHHYETAIKHFPSQPGTSYHQETAMKPSPSLPDTSHHQETPIKPSHYLQDTSHHQETPIKPSHYLQDTSHHQEIPLKSSPSLPDTSHHQETPIKSSPSYYQETPIKPSPSLPEDIFHTNTHTSVTERSISPTPDTIVTLLENDTTTEPYFTKLSPQIRDSSQRDSSDSENLYQIPRIDPIYQIPSSIPVLFTQRLETETETEVPKKMPLQKLHSVGHSITPSPKPSTEGPNYADLVSGYYCYTPNANTPPSMSPLSAHKRLSGCHNRSQSLPREYSTQSIQSFPKRRSSSSSSNSSRPNSSIMDTDSSKRMMSQIRELEEQLLALTSSSRRLSLSPSVSQSNYFPNILQTDAQRLIDNLRSVVFEAISFHKDASELLQSARTEKLIAERERQDAEQNSDNLRSLITKFQQST